MAPAAMGGWRRGAGVRAVQQPGVFIALGVLLGLLSLASGEVAPGSICV